LLEVVAISDNTNTITGRVTKLAKFAPVEYVVIAGGEVKAIHGEGKLRPYTPGQEPKLGELRRGNVITVPTTPYPIGEGADKRTVEKMTVVAFEGENAADMVNARLKEFKACAIVNGKPTVEFPKTKKGAKVGDDVPVED